VELRKNRILNEYSGITENSRNYWLTLFENNEFKYTEANVPGKLYFNEGNWKIINDTLILNSRLLDIPDSLNFKVENKSWLNFENKKYLIGNKKLIGLNKNMELNKIVD
jgi:hypothetical protein